MKKIILSILILILLTGCNGIYNLSNFILPDDSEFLALIEELDTPRKVCKYMKNNFEYETHLYTALTPYRLYSIQKGDCNDFSIFGTWIADYHGYETYQIEIFYKNTIYQHWLAIYKENNKYNFSCNQYYIPIKVTSLREIVEYHYYLTDQVWTKYIVYDYWNNEVETGIQ